MAAPAASLTRVPSLHRPSSLPRSPRRDSPALSGAAPVPNRASSLPVGSRGLRSAPPASFFRSSATCSGRNDGTVSGTCNSSIGSSNTSSLGMRSLKHAEIAKASSSRISPSDGGDRVDEMFEGCEAEKEVEEISAGISFLSKLAIALGVAATITVISICLRSPTPGSSFRFPFSADGSSLSVSPASPVGFTFSIFGHTIVLPEYTPGWIYFWMLMAAGCGLFISEEALNVWVGISLARTLSFDGTWKSFVHSFSDNAPYIISTVLWVYWGVCISDMIPFYLGKFFRRTKTSVDICSKLGIGKDKAVNITRAVQKYGNLIGFVERFSVGIRNPTSFLAGAWGISAECFFVGVCFGGLITLPIQLGIGFLLRERPMMAVAGVATAVGLWTVFPYLIAASTAVYIFLRQRHSD